MKRSRKTNHDSAARIVRRLSIGIVLLGAVVAGTLRLARYLDSTLIAAALVGLVLVSVAPFLGEQRSHETRVP